MDRLMSSDSEDSQVRLPWSRKGPEKLAVAQLAWVLVDSCNAHAQQHVGSRPRAHALL